MNHAIGLHDIADRYVRDVTLVVGDGQPVRATADDQGITFDCLQRRLAATLVDRLGKVECRESSGYDVLREHLDEHTLVLRLQ